MEIEYNNLSALNWMWLVAALAIIASMAVAVAGCSKKRPETLPPGPGEVDTGPTTPGPDTGAGVQPGTAAHFKQNVSSDTVLFGLDQYDIDAQAPEQAGLRCQLFHRRAGAGRCDHRAAADLSRLPRRADAAVDVDGILHAADRLPDGVAAAGVLRQDREDARAAGDGVAGVRVGGVLRRAADRVSLAHPVGGLGGLSNQPALGLEVLPRPGAPACGADARCRRAGTCRCCSLRSAGRG